MQNDEYTPDVELDENETTTEEVTEVTETTPDTEQVDWKAEALKWQAIAKRKSQQVAKTETQKPINTPPELSSTKK